MFCGTVNVNYSFPDHIYLPTEKGEYRYKREVNKYSAFEESNAGVTCNIHKVVNQLLRSYLILQAIKVKEGEKDPSIDFLELTTAFKFYFPHETSSAKVMRRIDHLLVSGILHLINDFELILTSNGKQGMMGYELSGVISKELLGNALD